MRKLLSAVFRSRTLLVFTIGLGFAIGAFMAISTPNSYVSEGKFLFTTTGSEIINVDPTRSGETSGETIAAAAVHVLKADNLLRRDPASLHHAIRRS